LIKKVWINVYKSSINQKEDKLNKFDSILKQNKEIKDFHAFDVDAEWNNFLNAVNEPSDQNESSTPSPKKSKGILFYLSFAMAASIALILVFSYALQPEQKIYNKFTATQDNEVLTLSDGSKIIPKKGANVEYPLELAAVNSRKIVLDGNAQFSVTRSILPFQVFYHDIMIEVLGTEFSLSKIGDKLLVENHKGSVKVSEIKNTSNFRILQKGDKFEYEKGKFTDLNFVPVMDTVVVAPKVEKKPDTKPLVKKEPTPEKEAAPVVESGSVYTLDSVLKGHLVKLNKKTIKLDKKFKYDKEQRVKVNLNQSFVQIMQSLKDKGVINFTPGECPDCYIITAPEPK